MIGKITGRVDYRGTDHVLVDVQGVGYMVYCSERTLTGLPSRGGVVALYTDLLEPRSFKNSICCLGTKYLCFLLAIIC